MRSTDPRRERRAVPRSSRPAALVFVAGVLATAACARTTAPRGFLPDPLEAQTDTYGSWIDVLVEAGGGSDRVQGELIAIDDDTAWVLADDGVRALETRSMLRGQVVGYDARAGSVGGGVVIGFLSTISNGAFLLLTGPMWLIGGSVAASHQSRLPIEDLTRETPATLSRFARFPAGMPEGLDTATLRGRPAR